jgi:hypothetical protein
MQNRIFSTDSPKAIKADAFGYLNAIHYMAPSDLSGFNLCPHASAGCKALCLGWTSGQASMVKRLSGRTAQGNSVRQSRIDKARRFMRDRKAYMADIVRSIELEQAKAFRLGKELCVRLNGSTDIAFEGIKCERNGFEHANLFDAFSDVQFVDYTKNHLRFRRKLPANYHLTFSRSETNEAAALQLLAQGFNVAVVFAAKSDTGYWQGLPVVDGDKHDLRHLDPKASPGQVGYIIALSPKGRIAKRDKTGFVIR